MYIGGYIISIGSCEGWQGRHRHPFLTNEPVSTLLHYCFPFHCWTKMPLIWLPLTSFTDFLSTIFFIFVYFFLRFKIYLLHQVSDMSQTSTGNFHRNAVFNNTLVFGFEVIFRLTNCKQNFNSFLVNVTAMFQCVQPYFVSSAVEPRNAAASKMDNRTTKPIFEVVEGSIFRTINRAGAENI